MNELLNHLKTRYVENLRSQNFEERRARVDEENRSGIVLIMLFTFLIILVNIVVQLVKGASAASQLMELGVYAVLGLSLYLGTRNRQKARYTIWIYLIEIPLLLISMVSGTIFETHGTTFTFMFILLVFPPLILDKPKRLFAFILIAAVAYAFMDYPFKGPDTFSRDMLHLFNVCLISMVAATYYASTRMENIRYAGYFAEKAVRDPLTGLYNRAGAEQNIDALQPGALVFIDLDNFKQINDTFGHAEGDRVLKKTAQVLRGNFRDDDVVIRLGGDEFAVYVRGAWSEDGIGRRLEQTLDALRRIKVAADGKDVIAVLASAGCAIAPHGCESLDKLIRIADEKMYEVKGNGKNGYRVVLID